MLLTIKLQNMQAKKELGDCEIEEYENDKRIELLDKKNNMMVSTSHELISYFIIYYRYKLIICSNQYIYI